MIMSAVIGIFIGTQERVRNSRGKRAIGVWAIEVRLYIVMQSADAWCLQQSKYKHMFTYCTIDIKLYLSLWAHIAQPTLNKPWLNINSESVCLRGLPIQLPINIHNLNRHMSHDAMNIFTHKNYWHINIACSHTSIHLLELQDHTSR